MISVELRHAFQFRHPERLVYALDKVPRSPTPAYYSACLKHLVNGTALLRHSAEEDSFTTIDIAVYDLRQHLGAGAIDRGDAVDIEDDVLVVLRRSDTWQGGVGGVGAIELKSPETILEVARVGKGEGFRDLDDEAAFDELERLRVVFSVLELVLRAWYFAEDLYAGFG